MDDCGDTDDTLEIVKPDRQEIDEGMSKLRKCMPAWRDRPALLVVKPRLGLIVVVQGIDHDNDGFSLTLDVLEALVAPHTFDAMMPIQVSCGWNQPYLSFDGDSISAPYGFSLHFGTEGVNRAREFCSTAGPETSADTEYLLGLLKWAFRAPPDCEDAFRA